MSLYTLREFNGIKLITYSIRWFFAVVMFMGIVVVHRYSVKKVFLKISQNLQENICTRVSFIKEENLAQVFSCEFSKMFKNACFYRAPLLAAFGNS